MPPIAYNLHGCKAPPMGYIKLFYISAKIKSHLLLTFSGYRTKYQEKQICLYKFLNSPCKGR